MSKSKIVIVGGKLQGLEAAYLGLKAGIEIVLVDKNPYAPAKNLCSKFICGDVLAETPEIMEEIFSADMVLPSMENDEVLEALTHMSKRLGFVIAFDWDAYCISSSKLLSDKLFHDNGIAAPMYYPEGGDRFIAKPISGSGSDGVAYFDTRKTLEKYIADNHFIPCDIKGEVPDKLGNLIVQEYLEGPSYSIEIIGVPGNYRTYAVTKIHMDEVYDCRMVTCPCNITKEQEKQFSEVAVKIAETMKLKGIMDFEVIDCDGEFKLLEIDARIPSQTPTAVYHATGMNFVEELRDIFCHGQFQKKESKKTDFACFEHIISCQGNIKSQGEHIMTQGGALRYIEGFCGADEAITDYEEGYSDWRATLINKAETLKQMAEKRKMMKGKLSDMGRR